VDHLPRTFPTHFGVIFSFPIGDRQMTFLDFLYVYTLDLKNHENLDHLPRYRLERYDQQKGSIGQTVLIGNN
jgi:hypothetical protein